MLIPINVFADHEPNPYDAWHQSCQDSYDKQVYIDGTVTQSNVNSLEVCKNQMPYPLKPPFVSDCNTLRDYEYEKLGRAVEVHGYDEGYQQQLADGIEYQHEICMSTAIEPNQVKCYVELDMLVFNHNRIENEFRTGTDGVEHWIGEKLYIDHYEEALHHYDPCMGFENEESKKLFDRLGSALYYAACYELPSKDLHLECFDSFRPLTVQQGWQWYEELNECDQEWGSGMASLRGEQRDDGSPEKAQVWSDVIQCFNENLLRLESEPQEPSHDANIDGFTPPPEIVCGTETVEKNGQCVPDYPNTEPSSKGGGCLIATATYGSELSPQVQQLRELRDNQLLQTESGSAFMGAFNDFYYSFSPIIADYERENPVFKEAVKIAITPMISSLLILNYVDMDSEVEVLGYGVSLILLNIGMYVGIPASVIIGILQINKKSKNHILYRTNNF